MESALDHTAFSPCSPSPVVQWKIALTTCAAQTTEAIYAALIERDPTIAKGRDNAEVLVALQKWQAETERHV